MATNAEEAEALLALRKGVTASDYTARSAAPPKVATNAMSRFSGVDPSLKGYQHITLLGSYNGIQTALSSMVYTPRRDWYGVDTVTISVSDRAASALIWGIIHRCTH